MTTDHLPTRVDVLRLLRERLDSIVSGIDDCIAHGGHAGRPVLLGAGTVYIHGVTKHGTVAVSCQDAQGVVDAEFDINIDELRSL